MNFQVNRRQALGAGAAVVLPATARAEPSDWVGAWRAAEQPALPGKAPRFASQTLRLILPLHLGGRSLRVRLSNRYGREPLRIAAARVAVRREGSAIEPETDRELPLPALIAPGEAAWSEALELPLAGRVDLALSLYLEAPQEIGTVHLLAMQTSYLAAGDQTAAATLTQAQPLHAWPAMVGVDVQGSGGGAVMAFGSSHVDGDGIAPDRRERFGDQLSQRLHALGHPTAVLNYGLIGNRLRFDSPTDRRNPVGPAFGEAGLRRFARELDDAHGATAVILCTSINDIGLPGVWTGLQELPRPEDLLQGYLQLAAQARARGLRVLISNLSPFENADVAPGYWTPRKEGLRRAFNRLLAQHAAGFDALLDFDASGRDPRHRSRLRPEFDSGDHLHPNAAGYAARAALVPLEPLRART
ncbi:MAG: GDSL-type esterase/lipase family protein [Inhella sp.]